MSLPVNPGLEGAGVDPEIQRQLKKRLASGASELFVPLAEIARRTGQAETALAFLEAGIERLPYRISAWVQMARVKTQLGRLDEANAHYRYVLEAMDPRNLPARKALAVAALAEGDLETAERHLRSWSQITPDDPELEDMNEELHALRDGQGDEQDGPQAFSAARGVMEMSLGDLEPGYIPAPALDDAAAWSGGGRARAAKAGGSEG